MFIVIRTSAIGEHRWATAPNKYRSLREFHKHKFEIQVVMEEIKSREIEFLDVKKQLEDFLSLYFSIPREESCEEIAESILNWLKEKFGQRYYEIEVDEDNGCGGMIRYGKI